MSDTITIIPSYRCREYISELYTTRIIITAKCEDIFDTCRGSEDQPEIAGIVKTALTEYRKAWDVLALIDDVLRHLGFCVVNDKGEFMADRPAIRRQNIQCLITDHERNDSPELLEVFRAVLSSLGIVYVWHDAKHMVIAVKEA